MTIKIQRVLDEQGHALLYCHSPARELKDRAIDAAKTAGFEAVLVKLQAGLSKPRGAKDVATIMERLGRAKQRYARAAQHYVHVRKATRCEPRQQEINAMLGLAPNPGGTHRVLV